VLYPTELRGPAPSQGYNGSSGGAEGEIPGSSHPASEALPHSTHFSPIDHNRCNE
jgi:hypothetical protein